MNNPIVQSNAPLMSVVVHKGGFSVGCPNSVTRYTNTISLDNGLNHGMAWHGLVCPTDFLESVNYQSSIDILIIQRFDQKNHTTPMNGGIILCQLKDISALV